MDALILAGGSTPEELASGLPTEAQNTDRALILLNGRPMLAYALDALHECPEVDRIGVVGTPGVLSFLSREHPQLLGVEAGPRMIQNALTGARALREQSGASRETLITTADVPLVKPETYSEFVRGFHEKKLDASYAIVKREVCEAQFPGGKRTYAKLKDGSYTAGNAVVVEAEALEKLASLFEEFYRARKNPIAMARILGVGFLWKALTKQLSVAQLEAHLSQIVSARFQAVEMRDASIAFDVDKIEDFHIAQRKLRQEASGAAAGA
jgi:GTP:adenosylcobinamide-phosphate guanylyltransferase